MTEKLVLQTEKNETMNALGEIHDDLAAQGSPVCTRHWTDSTAQAAQWVLTAAVLRGYFLWAFVCPACFGVRESVVSKTGRSQPQGAYSH